jgi:UDP-N-acetylglucosamine:LPS N-acetylglucosamine transferase
MSARPVILILTGSFGHGHNTAAHNLRAAFGHLLGDEIEIQVIDFFDHCYPEVNGLLRKAYAFVINSAPLIWRQLYRLGDMDTPGLLAHKALVQQFQRFLEERCPVAVVSTFPPNSILFKQVYPIASNRPFHLSTVITDSISISAMWYKGQSDLVFVTDEESKRVVMHEGVPEAQIQAHGFPIPFAPYNNSLPLPPPNQSRPRILYLPTTKYAHVKITIDHLVNWMQANDSEVTIVLGQNEVRLRSALHRLRDDLPPHRWTILGWVDHISQLMTEHHLVITKAGGASVSEALGAQCPLLINYVVPGQEEGNAQLVLQNECGYRIQNPEELPNTLSQVLISDQANTWHRYRARLSEMDRVKASLRIAEDIIKACDLTTK